LAAKVVVVVVVLVVALIQVVVAVDVSHSTVDAETDDRSIVHVVSQLSLLLGGAIVFISLLYLLRKHVGLVKRIRLVETTRSGDARHNSQHRKQREVLLF
jgi:TRAP-type C4-dicarboxylate transport system permease small subunit